MQTDAFNALRSFMGLIWSLFTGWKLPFTNVTPAMMIFFVLSIKIILKFVNSILSVGPTAIGHSASDELHRMQRVRRSREN